MHTMLWVTAAASRINLKYDIEGEERASCKILYEFWIHFYKAQEQEELKYII